ncbi:MAG: sulfoxide reductase heme-binding subunit YedZ [Rhodospirillaceae bacterium]|nr:MAG: sulfoxide reductase heme-binding subunit YedZ [Rhodospirillaceae bacterium]
MSASGAPPSASPRGGVKYGRLLKPAVFILCLLPLVWLAWRGFTDDLGANPIEAVIRFLGDWALRFLLIALAVTPVRIMTRRNEVARLRRMLGLFAFAYVVLHMLAYIGLDQVFDFHAIWRDVVKRIYITVGMSAFAMLTPLAVTSTDRMVRRLGGRNWRRLHRLAYLAGVAAVIHYILMVKAGYVQPGIYALILGLLLGVRVINAWRQNLSTTFASAIAAPK